MIQGGEVDGIWAIDPTRYGRAKWLYNYMIQYAVDHQVNIFANGVGVINESNFDAMVAITSVGSQAAVKKLNGARAQATYRAKMKAGIPPRGRPIWTHEMIRDGVKPVGVVVRDWARPIIRHLTDLLLGGYSYYDMERELKPLYSQIRGHESIRFLLWNPMVHGHIARYHKDKIGLWRLEPGHPMPDDKAEIEYNVVPPLWDSETHARVKVNLAHRLASGQGRYNARSSKNIFRGLLLCAVCERPVSMKTTRRTLHYLVCGNPDCKPQSSTKLENLKAFMDRYLRDGLARGVLMVEGNGHALQDWQDLIDDIQTLIAQTNAIISNLIDEKVRNVDHAELIQEKIDTQTVRVKQLQKRLHRVQLDKPASQEMQHDAMQRMADIGVDQFWELPYGEQNQLLHELIGAVRIYIRGDTIYDIRVP